MSDAPKARTPMSDLFASAVHRFGSVWADLMVGAVAALLGATVPVGQGGAQAVVGALSLYLNFVNLFLILLRLQGRRD